MGGILDRGRPAALHLGPPRAEVEASVGRCWHGRPQSRGGRRVDVTVDQGNSVRLAGALDAQEPRPHIRAHRLRIPAARIAVATAARREEADEITGLEVQHVDLADVARA